VTEIDAAIYARVSSEHQAQAQTIASQIAALRERVAADGLQLVDELTFIDDGFSGASLVRPALERLRDVAASGGLERLYVYSPDRLARRYAYQVLLMDELRRVGVEVTFLNRAVSQTPEDDLLLQVQGVVAEYERAKLLERVRRGRRHGAQTGALSVIGHAPYGYRYITKGEGGGQARFEVVLDQARVVRQVFEWVGRERVSMAEAARRLMAAKVPTATGLTKWDRSQIWTMLRNPTYQGTAAFGKTRMGPLRPRLRAPRGHTLQPRRPTSSYGTPAEEWITIPVPPLVSPELFTAVQEQLLENRRRAKQSPRCTQFLVQGLALCTCCGYAYCGGRPGRAVRDYGYYRCTGMDRFRFGGQAVCDNPAMRSDLLDAAVWAEVCALLQEPNRLLAEYQRRLEVAREPAGRDEVVVLETQLRRLRQGIGRLIDSYAEGFIAKSEFEPRVKRLKERVTVVERQLQQTQAVMAQRRDLHLVLGHLEDFAATVARKLDDLDWSARRAIVRALVKHVEVDYTHIRVVFRVGPGPVVLDSTTRMLQDREGRRTSLLDGRVVGGSPAHSSRYRIATVRSPIMVVRALAVIMWEQSPTWPRRRARARDAKVSAQ
jgi:site-specific DNA recombinase